MSDLNDDKYNMYELAVSLVSHDMWTVMEHEMLLTDSDAVVLSASMDVKEAVKWPVERTVHRFEDILHRDLAPPRHAGRRFA